MTDGRPVVLVVDDDVGVREAVQGLLRSVGMQVITFASVRDFLAAERPKGPSCLVLDIRMPGKSGLDLLDELNRRNIALPTIFITGHGDVRMSVRAMKAGAVEFLSKPFRDQELLDAIQAAVEQDSVRRPREIADEALRRKLDSLTAREREVLVLVAQGLLNKQIAAELDLSEITVKVHRGQTMRKMDARSLADLVLMADRLGLLTSDLSSGAWDKGKKGGEAPVPELKRRPKEASTPRKTGRKPRAPDPAADPRPSS
jgi:FixJ family two-component response regulator